MTLVAFRGLIPISHIREPMKTSALTISLLLILVPLTGCLGNNDSRIGCPDNPPEGTTCVPNSNVFVTGNDALDLVYAKETNLSGFDLRDADFSGAVLSYADFSEADLSGADLSGSTIRGANFINATITGTNFEGAIYDEHTFWYPGWNDKDGDGILDEGRVPEHIKDKMVYLGPETNLDGINLDGRLEMSFWPARSIDGIIFPGSIPANLSHSSLRGTSMSGIDLGLILTNFSDADLTGARVEHMFKTEGKITIKAIAWDENPEKPGSANLVINVGAADRNIIQEAGALLAGEEASPIAQVGLVLILILLLVLVARRRESSAKAKNWQRDDLDDAFDSEDNLASVTRKPASPPPGFVFEQALQIAPSSVDSGDISIDDLLEGPKLPEAGLPAVSYTHLTLPTILLV